MRLKKFQGLEPKTPDQNLEQYQAAKAENVDFRGGDSVKPWPTLEYAASLVDIYGEPFTGTPVTIRNVEGVWLAFGEHVTTAIDPRGRAGEGSFLFVQDGKVYRSSARWILDGQGPIEIGIPPPNKAPVVSVDKGENPNPERMPNNTCGVTDYRSDCHDLPPEARSYLKTYVNCMGEESAPSPLSEPMDVMIEDAVVLMDNESAPENAEQINYYRTVVDREGSVQLLFVESRPIDKSGYVDTLSALELGRPVATEGHYPPPQCADGIVDMGDNLVSVWSGREFWVSEPFFPHAFPNREVYKVDENIVHAQAIRAGTEARVEFYVYILTEGKPYIFNKPRGSGSGAKAQQGAFGPTPFYIDEPCVSAQSATQMDGSLAYCSPNGLITLTGGQTDSILDGVMTEREWQRMSPQDMALVYYRGMLIGYNNRQSWILTVGRYAQPRNPNFSTLSVLPTTSYSDPETGIVLGFPSASGAAYVSRWNSPTQTLMRGTWRSKVFSMPGLWQPAAMKVEADFPRLPTGFRKAQRDFQTWKRHKGSSLEAFLRNNPQYEDFRPFLDSNFCPVFVRVYCDGHIYYERTVIDNKPFRIPHKYYGIDWQMEVQTRTPVFEIQLENSIESLTKLGQGVGNTRG